MDLSSRHSNPRAARTYVAGEDANRLADAASYLGVEASRRPLRPVRDAVMSMLFSSDTLAAARMHSVGALGQNERVDPTGTLHYISVRRRRRRKVEPEYGTLTDLFHREPAKRLEGLVAEEEEEEEEEILEDMVEGGSLNAAIFGIIKGTVGPAILYLPRGFQVSGYAVAVPSMLFATAMYVYNAYRLLECWKVESDRNHKLATRMEELQALLGPAVSDGGEQLVVDAAQPTKGNFAPKLLTYPEIARRALGPYAFVVELGIALMQFGVCLTYLIFVPQNLYEWTLACFGLDLPKNWFLIGMVLIEIPLSWIRDIRKLTPTNVLATIMIAFGLCSVLSIAFGTGFKPASDDRRHSSLLRELV